MLKLFSMFVNNTYLTQLTSSGWRTVNWMWIWVGRRGFWKRWMSLIVPTMVQQLGKLTLIILIWKELLNIWWYLVYNWQVVKVKWVHRHRHGSIWVFYKVGRVISYSSSMMRKGTFLAHVIKNMRGDCVTKHFNKFKHNLPLNNLRYPQTGRIASKIKWWTHKETSWYLDGGDVMSPLIFPYRLRLHTEDSIQFPE